VSNLTLFVLSDSDDDCDTETTEDDGEAQLITECWIEPQKGRSCNCPRDSHYLNNLTFKQIPQMVIRI
jgi:hypothetical protein